MGENNSGKSNAIFALLWFLGKEKLFRSDVNQEIPDDPYVDIEFDLQTGEDFPYPKEYLVDGKFKVRATVLKDKIAEKGTACEYFGYTGNTDESLKDTKLLGWKTVAQPSFGDVVYMPSVRSLDEELKFTANSSLNQLVTKNVIARIKSEDEKSGHYQKIVESIQGLSQFISEGENSALQQLKKDVLGKMLNYEGIDLDFILQPPEVDDLIKSCFRTQTGIQGSQTKLPISSQGDGFQRSMMFSLIANLAELTKKEIRPEKSKAIKNIFTIYIIEEPELFLHPNHQTYFRNKLEELAENNESQVILTSHSPYFLNNVKQYSQIKRIYIENNHSKVAQVEDNKIEEICKENGALIAKAKNECLAKKLTQKELEGLASKVAEEDQLRYLLWIDPNRANAFLSKKVILVEGPTEKALFAYLFNNPSGEFFDVKETANIAVVDVVGKYHFYKFARLLNLFGIKVWCIYDGDEDKCKHNISHKVLNENIELLKSQSIIENVLRIDPFLEEYLGIEKDESKPDINLYSSLANNINSCKDATGYKNLTNFVKSIIDS